MRHGESCANVTKEEYGGNPFTMFAHTFYSDPELSGFGLATVRDFSIGDYLERGKRYFICSSALLRAQETAFYLSENIPGENKISNRIYVLPFIKELGNTDDNKPMKEDDRNRLMQTTYREDLRQTPLPQTPLPEALPQTPYENSVLKSRLDFGYYDRVNNRDDPDPKKFESFLLSNWANFDSISPGVGPVNLLIVTHNQYMSTFQKEILGDRRAIKYKNLDFMKFSVRGYNDTDTGTPRAQFSKFVPHTNMIISTRPKSCERGISGGRCRKKVCRAARQPTGVPTEEPVPSSVPMAAPTPPGSLAETRECRTITDLLRRGVTAKYDADITYAAGLLSATQNPTFKKIGEKMTSAYKPGWFSTRSPLKLKEDVAELFTPCGIGEVIITKPVSTPGSKRYGSTSSTLPKVYVKAENNSRPVDREGFDKDGFGRDGFNREGFGRDGFNREGFDEYGFGRDGFNREGFNEYGFGRDGFNREGFDEYGFGRDGFNKKGIDKDGFGRDGFNEKGIDKDGFGRDGYDEHGLNREGRNREGRIPHVGGGARRTRRHIQRRRSSRCRLRRTHGRRQGRRHTRRR